MEVEVNSKSELESLAKRLSDQTIELGTLANELCNTLGNVSDYDGIPASSAGRTLSSNMKSIMEDFDTVATNINSYISELITFDVNDFPTNDMEKIESSEEIELPNVIVPGMLTDEETENNEESSNEEIQVNNEKETDTSNEEDSKNDESKDNSEVQSEILDPGQVGSSTNEKDEITEEKTSSDEKNKVNENTSQNEEKQESLDENSKNNESEPTKEESSKNEENKSAHSTEQNELKEETSKPWQPSEKKESLDDSHEQTAKNPTENISQNDSISIIKSDGMISENGRTQRSSLEDIRVSVGGNIDISNYTNNIENGFEVTIGNNAYELCKEDVELLYAIIAAQGDKSYDESLALMTALLNRCEDPNWISINGKDPIAQITALDQFTSYQQGNYMQYLDGNVSDTVINAVNDALSGVRNHKYLNFSTNDSIEFSNFMITNTGNRYK